MEVNGMDYDPDSNDYIFYFPTIKGLFAMPLIM
jgi:hypothetical protein